jgi:hypothetical protein
MQAENVFLRVPAVFGISTPPTEQSPSAEDSNVDKIAEEICKELFAATNAHSGIARESISNRQRTALRGTEALATILDFSEQGSAVDLDLLITKCCTLRSALKCPVPKPLPTPVAEPAGQPMYAS